MVLDIVGKSMRLIFENFGAAMRIAFLPLVLAVGLSAWAQIIGLRAQLAGELPPWFVEPVEFLNVAMGIWVAVAWHRFVLLGEGPMGVLPRFEWRAMVRYVLAGLGLLVVWGVLIAVIVFGMFALGGQGMPRLGATVSLGSSALLAFIPLVLLLPVMLRVSLVLPAAAVGGVMSPRDLWQATQGRYVTFAGICFVVFLLALMTAFVMSLLLSVFVAGSFAPAGDIEAIFVSAIMTMSATTAPITLFWSLFSVSLLTTLYGALVEGREI